jgi:hypothetical protein
MKQDRSDLLLITSVLLVASNAFVQGFSAAGKLIAALAVISVLIYAFIRHRDDVR